MWGRVLRLYRNKCTSEVNLRTFLSAAYRCDEAWAARTSGRALRSVKPDDLYIKLEQHSQQQAVSPIDIDVFANCATADHLGEVRDLLHKLRNSAHAHCLLPSTHYATIRTYADAGENALPDLLNILDDRLNYGIYLDRFTANMLFDKLLKTGDFESASRIAGFLMLQENFEGPITEEFALYSTYKYLSVPILPKIIEEQPKEPQKKQKKPEEIKIRVGFLRNPYFDDHFDLTDKRMIAGKTLAMLTSKKNDATSTDCNFLGWISYRKFEKAKEATEKLIKKGSVYKETTDMLKNFIETYEDKDENNIKQLEEISAKLNSITALEKPLEEEIKQNLLNVIKKNEKNDIDDQIQTFSTWEKIRESKLQDQLERLENLKKENEKQARENIIKELDEKIWFFDNEEKVDLEIEKKRSLISKRTGSKKRSKTIDTSYVPPEVGRHASRK